MKWRRSAARIIPVAALLAAAGLRAELADYIQNLELTSRLQGVFFRSVSLAGATVLARRPPRESRQALDAFVLQSPDDAALYALRAREAELALDFTAAEADWKKHAGLAADRGAGLLALADFYHRRLRPAEEVSALLAAARAPAPASDRFLPVRRQRAWLAFERAQEIVSAQSLPAGAATAMYRAWIERYPREVSVRAWLFDVLVEQSGRAAAEDLLAAYVKEFPGEAAFPVRARASLARRQGGAAQALAVYERSFRPLWPAELVREWFALLKETRGLRRFHDQARAAAAADPDAIEPAARLFYYWQQQGNLEAARRALAGFRARKDSRKPGWQPEELLTLARLFEGASAYDDAARCYYGLYSLPGAPADTRAEALAGLITALLAAPEQPAPFGNGDLSLYRDIATIDTGPGFLNGVLSLLLNASGAHWQFAAQEQRSSACHHRARAAGLVARFDAEFPNSPLRSGLHARLIEAFSIHGDSGGVIRAARAFLASFPAAPGRAQVSLLLAEAYARQRRSAEEFAVYDALLAELAKAAEQIPLGESIARAAPPAAPEEPAGEVSPWERAQLRRQAAERSAKLALQARSPDYARVLDRYIARLVAFKRTRDVLALYRREIDRNPSDPGLYERLAAFLEQNKLAAEVEEVYRRAMRQFQDRSWHHKLSRWYLRRKQHAQFAALAREVAAVFSGSELERYFREVVGGANLDAVLYRQVNLFAQERFPHNLTFVRNLLAAYQRPGSADPAAWERLIRNYWFYDGELASRFFEFLSRTGRLEAELQAAAAAGGGNPAAQRFTAEAEAWRSHFESAAPGLRALAAACPGCAGTARRASSLERSLGGIERAAAIEENLHRFAPRDTTALAALGDLHASREDFAAARPWWNRIPEVEPGRPDGYLEAATIFWDYYLFDDALRLIAAARAKLKTPALFAYEAGAIYENQRDYARAIDEYARGALSDPEGSPARSRLIELARRPAHRAAIEAMTARLAAGSDPEPAAMSLRVTLLEAQGRRADLERYLLELAGRASSPDTLLRVRESAGRQGFTGVQRNALAREAELAADPVDRMRARLALARFDEANQKPAAAGEIVEALYRENPAVLGVVREAVDFHWRNKNARRAVEILEQAAARAHPALSRQFTYEAARKATEAGNTGRARKLLAGLLKQEPLNPANIAAMADTWARDNNDAALRDFYAAKLGEIREPSQAAALRRGLIQVLTRSKDHAGAIEQYIQLINRYPEDEGLSREAAQYASAHNLRPRLLDFYRKAAAASPKDARWPIILARLHTHFEDFPAAIAAYEQAVKARPERTDLYIARASLEERLHRFDDAIQTCRRVYELTYHNPEWMERAAELHARQGRRAEAVEALRLAYLEGRPERSWTLLQVAARLERWNFLEDALSFAERAIAAASGNDPPDFTVWARIMARLKRHQQAWARLGGTPQARLALASEIGRFATPEEKAAFAALLDRERAALPAELMIGAARNAGLHALEARWIFEAMRSAPGSAESQMLQQRLIELQRMRLRHEELGRQLEAYWKVHPKTDAAAGLLDLAAGYYRIAGETAAEIRALTAPRPLPQPLEERLHELLRTSQPGELLARAAQSDQAAAFAVQSGDASLALQAVAARGRSMPPVWTSAYSGLTGLHYLLSGPEVRAAWQAALGGGTIGERTGKPVNRDLQLAGELWFYYGGRYGEYLAATKQGGAEDYLPAPLEARPGNAQAYFELARYYEETGDLARAAADYLHAAELNPDRADAHDRLAVMAAGAGRRDEAVSHWRQALAAFSRQQDARRLPGGFWDDVRAALENIGRAGALAPLKNDADRLLRTYVRRNGAYRVQPLLRGAFAAPGDAASGLAWILDLSRAAADPLRFLDALLEEPWLPASGRAALFRHLRDHAGERAAQAVGDLRAVALNDARNWRERWIGHLVESGETARARQEIGALSAPMREQMGESLILLEVRIAVKEGRLPGLIERWKADPDRAPPAPAAREEAVRLREQGDRANAARLLEFTCAGELAADPRNAAAHLGLAEARLDLNDPEGAIAILRRMTLVAGDPLANLGAAAALLEGSGRRAEALEFREAEVRAMPWDYGARVRLAEALLASGRERERAVKLLGAAASDAAAPYLDRADAAAALGGARAGGGFPLSGELALLASAPSPAAAAANQPYFAAGRIAAAGAAPEAERIALLTPALGVEPGRESARVALLRAALAAGSHRAAVAALDPLLDPMRHLMVSSGGEPEPPEPDVAFWASQVLAGAGLDKAERASLARGAGTAYQARGWPGAAALLYRIALSLAPSAEARASLDALRSAQALAAANRRRGPEIRGDLIQNQLVRPRLERLEGAPR